MAKRVLVDRRGLGKDRPLIPMGRWGVKPMNNRRVISGILRVLKYGYRWRDGSVVYGPHTTIYNQFNRWSKAGIWQVREYQGLGQRPDLVDDSTTSKAHRCSAGGKATALAVKHRFALS